MTRDRRQPVSFLLLSLALVASMANCERLIQVNHGSPIATARAVATVTCHGESLERSRSRWDFSFERVPCVGDLLFDGNRHEFSEITLLRVDGRQFVYISEWGLLYPEPSGILRTVWTCSTKSYSKVVLSDIARCMNTAKTEP